MRRFALAALCLWTASCAGGDDDGPDTGQDEAELTEPGDAELLANPGFDEGLARWLTTGPGTTDVVSGTGEVGAAAPAVRLIATAGTRQIYQNVARRFAAGERVQVSVAVRGTAATPATGGSVRVGLRRAVAPGDLLGQATCLLDAGWYRCGGTFEVPAGFADAPLRAFVLATSTTSATAYLDDVSVRRAGASTGQLENGEFEHGLVGWTPVGAGTLGLAPASDVFNGAGSARVAASGGNLFLTQPLPRPVKTGQVVEVTAWAGSMTAGAKAQLQLRRRGGDAALLKAASCVLETSSDYVDFTFCTLKATVPETFNDAPLELRIGATTGQTVVFDGVKLASADGPTLLAATTRRQPPSFATEHGVWFGTVEQDDGTAATLEAVTATGERWTTGSPTAGVTTGPIVRTPDGYATLRDTAAGPLVLTRLDAGGAPAGAPVTLPSTVTSLPSAGLIALADGGLVTVARGPAGAHLVRVSSEDAVTVTSLNTGAVSAAAIGGDADGAVVVWQKPIATVPTCFVAPISATGAVGGTTMLASACTDARIAASPAGFLAVWTDTSQTVRKTRAQKLTRTGTLDGAGFQLSEAGTAYAYQPIAAWDPSLARYRVAWDQQGPGGYRIAASELAPTDASTGGWFRIVSGVRTGGVGLKSFIEVDGKPVIAWHDTLNGVAGLYREDTSIAVCGEQGTPLLDAGRDRVELPSATTIFATWNAAGSKATCREQRRFTQATPMVIPAAIPVVRGRGFATGALVLDLRTAPSGWQTWEGYASCRYLPDPGSRGDLYRVDRCYGVEAGTERSITQASLSFEGTPDGASGQVVVAARTLPRARFSSDERLDLVATTLTSTLRQVGERRRVALRAFDGAREVDVSTLGLTLRSERDGDIGAALSGDGSVVMTAKIAPNGYNAIGVRAEAHPAHPSTIVFGQAWWLQPGAVMLGRDEVLFPRAVRAPNAGAPPPFVTVSSRTGEPRVGTFGVAELAASLTAPGPTPEETPVSIVVPAERGRRLAIGTLIASEDNSLFGQVTGIDSRGAFARVTLSPRDPWEVFASGKFRYDGQLERDGYTSGSAGPVGQVQLPERGEPLPSADGANARVVETGAGLDDARLAMSQAPAPVLATSAAGGANWVRDNCEVEGAWPAIHLKPLDINVRVAALGPGEFALDFSRGVLDEAKVSFGFDVSVFFEADFSLQFTGAVTATCKLWEGRTPAVPLPMPAFAISAGFTPELFVEAAVTGGPRVQHKLIKSYGVKGSMAYEQHGLAVSVPDGQLDLDENGRKDVFEVKSYDESGVARGVELGIGGALDARYAPDFSIEGKLGISPKVDVSVTATVAQVFGTIKAMPWGIGDWIISKVTAEDELDELLTVSRAEVPLETGVAFRYHSTGDILNAFDATRYFCKEVQTQGLYFEPDLSLQVPTLEQIGQYLKKVSKGWFEVDMPSLELDLPPMVLSSLYRCLDPADQGDLEVTYLRGFMGGEDDTPQASCESPSATEWLSISAWTQAAASNTTVVGPEADPVEARVYFDEGPGWVEIGTVPLVSNARGYQRFAGGLRLSDIAARSPAAAAKIRANDPDDPAVLGVLSFSRNVGGMVIPNEIGDIEVVDACELRAVDDTFGAEPGVAKVLEVLDNDFPPNGATITSLEIVERPPGDPAWQVTAAIRSGNHALEIDDFRIGEYLLRYQIQKEDDQGQPIGATASATVKVSVSCPADRPYDATRNRCVRECLPPNVFNPILGECVCDQRKGWRDDEAFGCVFACEPGEIWNDTTMSCTECPFGAVPVNGACVCDASRGFEAQASGECKCDADTLPYYSTASNSCHATPQTFTIQYRWLTQSNLWGMTSETLLKQDPWGGQPILDTLDGGQWNTPSQNGWVSDCVYNYNFPRHTGDGRHFSTSAIATLHDMYGGSGLGGGDLVVVNIADLPFPMRFELRADGFGYLASAPVEVRVSNGRDTASQIFWIDAQNWPNNYWSCSWSTEPLGAVRYDPVTAAFAFE